MVLSGFSMECSLQMERVSRRKRGMTMPEGGLRCACVRNRRNARRSRSGRTGPALLPWSEQAELNEGNGIRLREAERYAQGKRAVLPEEAGGRDGECRRRYFAEERAQQRAARGTERVGMRNTWKRGEKHGTSSPGLRPAGGCAQGRQFRASRKVKC